MVRRTRARERKDRAWRLGAGLCALALSASACAGALGSTPTDHTQMPDPYHARANDPDAQAKAWAALRDPDALDVYLKSLEDVFQGPCAAVELAKLRAAIEAGLRDGDAYVLPALAPCAWDGRDAPPLKGALMREGQLVDEAPSLKPATQERWRVHVILQIHEPAYTSSHPDVRAFFEDVERARTSEQPERISVDACQRRIVSTVLSTPSTSQRLVLAEGVVWRPAVDHKDAPRSVRALGLPVLPRWKPIRAEPINSDHVLMHMFDEVGVWGFELERAYEAVYTGRFEIFEVLTRTAGGDAKLSEDEKTWFAGRALSYPVMVELGDDIRDTSAILRGVVAAGSSPDWTSWVIIGQAHGENLYRKMKHTQETAPWVEFVVHSCVRPDMREAR